MKDTHTIRPPYLLLILILICLSSIKSCAQADSLKFGVGHLTTDSLWYLWLNGGTIDTAYPISTNRPYSFRDTTKGIVIYYSKITHALVYNAATEYTKYILYGKGQIVADQSSLTWIDKYNSYYAKHRYSIVINKNHRHIDLSKFYLFIPDSEGQKF